MTQDKLNDLQAKYKDLILKSKYLSVELQDTIDEIRKTADLIDEIYESRKKS